MTNDERIHQELASLLRERRSGLLAQVDVIRNYRHGLTGAEQARESAHRLAGTLGLFGFCELGQEASRMEASLSIDRIQSVAQLDDFIERAIRLLSE